MDDFVAKPLSDANKICEYQSFFDSWSVQEGAVQSKINNSLKREMIDNLDVIKDLKMNNNQNDTGSNDSFNPRYDDTSSHFDPSETTPNIEENFNPPECFPKLEIGIGVREFDAKVLKVMSPLRLYVLPALSFVNSDSSNLNGTLRKLSTKKLTAKDRLAVIEEGANCLALPEGKTQWLRAVILNVDYPTKSVVILLVDELKTTNVKFVQLRRCPSEIRKFSVPYLEVELTNVKPQRHLRNSDIIQRLKISVLNQSLHVVVVEQDEPLKVNSKYDLHNYI